MGPRVLASGTGRCWSTRSNDGLALLKFFGLTFALSWALWKVSARWYLFAFFYMAAVKLAAAVVHRLAAGIWAVWHLPLFLIAGTDTAGQSLPFFVISVTAISVVLAWLYARTGGSLLLVMLMHAAANNTPHFVPPAPVATGSVWALEASPVQWRTALFLWIGAAYLLVRMRKVHAIA